MRSTWRKPKPVPQWLKKDGYRQMRDGEPRFLPMRRWQNDRTLSTEMRVRCCDCGLEHMYTFNLLTDPAGEYYLLKRAYRLDSGRKKVVRRPRGRKK